MNEQKNTIYRAFLLPLSSKYYYEFIAIMIFVKYLLILLFTTLLIM